MSSDLAENGKTSSYGVIKFDLIAFPIAAGGMCCNTTLFVAHCQDSLTSPSWHSAEDMALNSTNSHSNSNKSH